MNNELQEVPPLEGFREAFKDYLLQRRYKQSTIKSHLQNIGYFFQWINNNQLYEVENIEYKNLLEYVQHEQKRGIDTATINLRLNSISKYFDFLKTEAAKVPPLEGFREARNPARTLRIKGKLKTITEQPLKYAELEQLYFIYKGLNKVAAKNRQQSVYLAHQRNIVVVGLLVWQGLHSYLHGGIRDKLLKSSKAPPSEGFGEALFAVRTHDILTHLLEELKGINPVIKNAQHIRASVILYWLKQYNKRQVQYMAGHKYIDSTEKYAVQQMDTLTDQLTKHHPFG